MGISSADLAAMSLTPEQRAAVDRQTQRRAKPAPAPAPRPARAVHRPGLMNKLEAAYAAHLERRRVAGEILRYDFEPVKLRLAPSTFYSPDFRVVLANGELEMHEVKGFWEDDARVKIKVAAEMHPYRFIGVKRIKGEWEYEVIGGVATL